MPRGLIASSSCTTPSDRGRRWPPGESARFLEREEEQSVTSKEGPGPGKGTGSSARLVLAIRMEYPRHSQRRVVSDRDALAAPLPSASDHSTSCDQSDEASILDRAAKPCQAGAGGTPAHRLPGSDGHSPGSLRRRHGRHHLPGLRVDDRPSLSLQDTVPLLSERVRPRRSASRSVRKRALARCTCQARRRPGSNYRPSTNSAPQGPLPTGTLFITCRAARSMTETSFEGPLAV